MCSAFDELLTFALVAPSSFSSSLLSYLSLHPLPARGPPPSRGAFPGIRGGPQAAPLQQQQQQQHQLQQLQLLQQHQSDANPLGTVKVYGDASGQIVTSISGGPSPGGPPAAATKRSKLRSMLSLKRSSPQGGAPGAPAGAPQGGHSESSPLYGEGGPPQGPSCASAAAAAAATTAAAEGGAPSGSYVGSPAAAAGAAAVAAAATSPQRGPLQGGPLEEGPLEDESDGLCDSDDSDLCAASLAALSVADAAGGGPRGPHESRALCWRAGKRLHLGLPPESYALSKQQ